LKTIENEYFKITVDKGNGCIISIFDKKNKKEFSFLKIEPHELFLTCLKPKGFNEASYENKQYFDIVARFYEPIGKKNKFKISFFLPIKEASKCNFLEEKKEKLNFEKK
jgi:alpha-mannosidase